MADEALSQSLDDVLAKFREDSDSNRESGDLFERLVASYLLADPKYNFDSVWLWPEWPLRWGPDTGIDLVARERNTGDYWAIQCKFFLPSHIIQKADIDSFFTASGKRFADRDRETGFVARLVVTTTERISKHAEDALADQAIPTARLTLADLAASPVDWSKVIVSASPAVPLIKRNTPREDQKLAVSRIVDGLSQWDRGHIVMACGTGKTFTSLKSAEALVSPGGLVVFLAPSIQLVAQSLREWTAQAETRLRAFVVCSDAKVGKESEDLRSHDLAFPATTDAAKLGRHLAMPSPDRITVVFSTYQSIDVLISAQKQGMPEIDLVVCDEAHRTTGIEDAGGHLSEFVKVHENRLIRAKKRLYMTATPRVYADSAKTKADAANVSLYSMDDPAKFGPELHRVGFGEAVSMGLLTEYKVLIVAVDQDRIAGLVNNVNTAFMLDERKAIDVEFAVKVIGSWKGLSKQGLMVVGGDGEPEPLTEDVQPMKRAVAFARSIKASKDITDTFSRITEIFEQSKSSEDASERSFTDCQLRHVDGTMNALVRQKALSWLKQPTDEGVCRLLSNARCLSEGIDVPTLDGVVFFDTRDSMVDIVQSVGRVMRRADNKKFGYIILPVGIPWAQVSDYNDYVSNDKQFKAIWKVLKALRAHDDRLVDEAVFRSRVQIVVDPTTRPEGEKAKEGEQLPIDFPMLPIQNLSEAVYTAIPKRLGDREYWSSWAADIGKRAGAIIARIQKLIESDPDVAEQFATFLKGLQDTLNPAIKDSDAIEMLAQHILTLPVFQALFSDKSFPQNNVVGRALEAMAAKLTRASIDSETVELQRFYNSVTETVAKAKSDKTRQEIVRVLYDTFFKTAFEDVAKRFGMVYTPIPVVDFIIKSADAALQKHFGRSLKDQNVHILDPFAGTGAFPVRLLQSGLIPPEDLPRKYANELHVNEIVLLAYYVANINVETAYHAATGEHQTFEGMVLTDTFQITEEGDLIDEVLMPENNARIERQAAAPIQVIIGNPPYSVTQGDAKYPTLDRQIATTYGAGLDAQNLNSLYDSYIRSLRWASNRIGEQGVICFVTNGGWIDGKAMSGLRRTFREEFSDIYVFNLRGNQRTKGEESRREGGKIFGGGSRAPVAITVMVRNQDHAGPGTIHYRDIGDYLSEKQKLEIIEQMADINGVPWETLEPNEHHDWINHRSEDFQSLVPIAGEGGIFETYQRGVETSRDPWVYDFSRQKLERRIREMVAFYNDEAERHAPRGHESRKSLEERLGLVKSRITKDPSKIKWTRGLVQDLARGKRALADEGRMAASTYRPFAKQWVYYCNHFNEYYKPRLWPTSRHTNRVIQITGVGGASEPSALITDTVANVQTLFNGQCFPLHHYVKVDAEAAGEMFASEITDGFQRRDGITDSAITLFRAHYTDSTIQREDIFYYVYGVLHSPVYLRRYRNDLKRELPRIPLAPDFAAFVAAGRQLAEIHLNYETAEPFELTEERSRLVVEDRDYRVRKMRFGKTPTGAKDKTVIHYNDTITLRGIPLDAYRYVVNGTPAIEWIMDQYQPSQDRESQIAKDPNDWSDDPRYILDLVKRMVTVSVRTMEIVDWLPPIE